MNKSLSEVSNAAFAVQDSWIGGNRSRFELVDYFFDALVPFDFDDDVHMVQHSLPRIKVLVTTMSGGVQIFEPTNRQELKDSMIKTTWIPYVTGWGFLSERENDDIYFDGGFSRVLHPECETNLHLPLIWDTLVHTFSPSLSREQVRRLWHAGYHYDYRLPKQTP
jgi:hypothetical protein